MNYMTSSQPTSLSHHSSDSDEQVDITDIIQKSKIENSSNVDADTSLQKTSSLSLKL